jgi:hypothetical protein
MKRRYFYLPSCVLGTSLLEAPFIRQVAESGVQKGQFVRDPFLPLYLRPRQRTLDRTAPNP